MKKITIFTIILSLLLALSSFVCADNSYKVGDEVTVTFTVNSSKPVAAGDYTISFESDKLQYVAGSISPRDKGEDYEVISTSSVRGLFTGENDVKTITAKFKTLKAGSTNVSLSFAKVGDEDGIKIEGVTVAPVTVNIVEPTQIPSTSETPSPSTSTTVSPSDNGDDTETPSASASTTVSSTSDDGKDDETNATGSTFHQTGVSIAAVATIALVAVIGSAIVIKRK